LQRAVRHLRTIAERGTLGDDPADLMRTARAAALAVDFYHIATTLRQTRDDPIATELGLALGGTLEGDSQDTSAHEHQSQYWVGVLLAQSGLRPAVPTDAGTRPDFVVQLNDLGCGVEVKRPRGMKAARRLLKDAADQLRAFGGPGIIALDLSAAIGTASLVLPQAEAAARDVIRDRLFRAADQLDNYIHRYERSDKFNRVIALVTFARFWVWASLDPPISDAGIVFTVTIFPKAYSGILLSYGERLQEMLLRGIEKLTGNPVEYRHRR
jgi:hypothetical protein